MRLIDLSHTVSDGTVTYPGLPAPRITQHLGFDESHGHYADGTEFAIGRIDMVANTGTYLDTPAHRYRDGGDLGDLPIEKCVLLPAIVVDCSDSIEPDVFADVAVAGHAVLLRTGWSRHWATEAYGDAGHPNLSKAGAEALVAAGATLVGIDSVNIDDMRDGTRPAHSVLLAARIPVVEHLTNLAALPADGFRFTAAPPKIRGLATFPVRAFASIE